jgi:hypothetical protein
MPYQPNAPQQLPQLQARPDMSGAQALQTVGETIAGLGKLGADYLNMRKAASTAAATEAAAKWEQDQLLNKGVYEQEASGTKIPSARDSYFKKLDGDTSKYEADLGPEARTEFQKRVSFKRKSFKNAGDLYAKDQSDKYIFSVNKDELSRAQNDLAMSYASDESDLENIGRIAIAAQSLASIDGSDPKKTISDSMLSARYGAMAHLAKTGTDEQIIRYHAKNKGSFGMYEGPAEEVVQKAKTNVAIRTTFADVAKNATDESGNFSPELAGKYDLSGFTDAVQDGVRQSIQQYAAADARKRTEIGRAVVDTYEMAQITGEDKVLESDPRFKEMLARMDDDHKRAYIFRKTMGPKASHPDDLQKLRTFGNMSSNTPEGKWYDTVPLSGLRITQEEKLRVMEDRQRRAAGDKDKLVKDVAHSIWTEGGRRLPTPKSGSLELDSDQAKVMADYSEFTESLIASVNAKQIDKNNIEQLRASARDLHRTFDEAAPGVFGGGVDKYPLYRASTMPWAAPTQSEREAAGVPASASPDEAILKTQAWRLRNKAASTSSSANEDGSLRHGSVDKIFIR